VALNNLINSSSKLTKFVSSGTWAKNPRTKMVYLMIWGGGGGGGSGRRGASATNPDFDS